MEGVLTEITNPNIVLETITSRKKSYSANKPVEKDVVEETTKHSKAQNSNTKTTTYNTYTDFQREQFIDKMSEAPF
ncbi:uncharacterized protein BX663DRAFT_5437 [Cokeromyces recurvatus]|uniref:uncharacterized protein n=1 Tax=Cokeromyces recurvatus TaxID=90255 RepID=UPI00221E94B1|nr:uncharacterized protein BX663DRAFT_5437 [Cokeromyces recurvatus]KAI7907604.1 hypothetical protein BX663DRAFT_5437 [Cokeromyces recurvatus]